MHMTDLVGGAEAGFGFSRKIQRKKFTYSILASCESPKKAKKSSEDMGIIYQTNMYSFQED